MKHLSYKCYSKMVMILHLRGFDAGIAYSSQAVASVIVTMPTSIKVLSMRYLLSHLTTINTAIIWKDAGITLNHNKYTLAWVLQW